RGAASGRRWRLRASSVVPSPSSVTRDRRAGRLTIGGQLLVLRQVILRHLRRAELVRPTVHGRHLFPVAVRRRRGQRPLEAVVVPWVLPRGPPLLQAPPEVHE